MESWLGKAPFGKPSEALHALPPWKGGGPLTHPLVQGRAPRTVLWLTPSLAVSGLQPHHPRKPRRVGGPLQPGLGSRVGSRLTLERSAQGL